MSTVLHFLSWVRDGLGAGATQGDDVHGPLPARGETRVGFQVSARPEQSLPVRLLGPGDVTGVDPRQLIRTEPRDGSAGFEPAYFPFVEFDRPDLPWMFTPAHADAQERLRPWMALVVVPESSATLETGPAAPLPVLIAPRAELPDPDDAWAWAHAQLAVDLAAGETPDSVLRNHPDRTLSRVVSPRRLAESTRYLACLVPLFEVGRRAGLGDDPFAPGAPADSPLDGYAWEPGGEGNARPLPVYLHWRFETGPAGDFEQLAKRLKPLPLEAGTGLREMDIGQADPDLPALTGEAEGRFLGFEGALRAPETRPTPWPGAARDEYQAKLRTVLDEPDRRLTAPVYGSVHAGVPRVPGSTAKPHWLRELNLDPRHRAAAALGTRVVQDQQEALMASAWRQAEEIGKANQLVAQGELARAVSARTYDRRVQGRDSTPRMGDGRLLQVAHNSLALVRSAAGSTTPVTKVLSRSPETLSATSPVFSRVARPFGPLARRLAGPETALPDVVVPLAYGYLSPLGAWYFPRGIATMQLRSGNGATLEDLTPAHIRSAPGMCAALPSAGGSPPYDAATGVATAAAADAATDVDADTGRLWMVGKNGHLYEAYLAGAGARVAWLDHGMPGNAVAAMRPFVFSNRRIFVVDTSGVLWERQWADEQWRWANHYQAPWNGSTVALTDTPSVTWNGRMYMPAANGSVYAYDPTMRAWAEHPLNEGTLPAEFATRPMWIEGRLFVGTYRVEAGQRRPGYLRERVAGRWVPRGQPVTADDDYVEEVGPLTLGGLQHVVRTKNGRLLARQLDSDSSTWGALGTPGVAFAGPLVAKREELGPLVTWRMLAGGGDGQVWSVSASGYLNAQWWAEPWKRLGSEPVSVAMHPRFGLFAVRGESLVNGETGTDLGKPRDVRGAGASTAPAAVERQRWAIRTGYLSTLVAANAPIGQNGKAVSVTLRHGRRTAFDGRPSQGWSAAETAFQGTPDGSYPVDGGIALASGYLRGSPGVGSEDLVMAWCERIGGLYPEQRLRYRVRFGSAWGAEQVVPLPPQGTVRGIAITVGDLDGDGRPELVFVYNLADAASGGRAFYRIGWRLNGDGEVTGGWSDARLAAPGLGAADTLAAALVDLGVNGTPDLLVMAGSGNTLRWSVGSGVNARGVAPGGWSAPQTRALPAGRALGGIAVADFTGGVSADLVLLTTEVRNGSIAGFTEVWRTLGTAGAPQTYGAPEEISGVLGVTGSQVAFTVADVESAVLAERKAMNARFCDAAPRHQDFVLKAEQRANRVPAGQGVDVAALAARTRGALEPTSALDARLRARVDVGAGAPARLRPLLAAPSYPQPMYEALRDLAPELLFPGIEGVPPESVTLLRTNPTFIESFLVGLNHELARELLWREFPADRAATFFRQFWDVRGAAAEPGRALEDIPPIAGWDVDDTLGASATDVGRADMLVLLLRGALLGRYPNAAIYAHRAVWELDGATQALVRTPVERPAPGDIVRPQFRGRLDPDLAFFGLPLTLEEALSEGPREAGGDAGWFLVIEQPPTEVRLGINAPFDRGAEPVDAWDDVHWGDLPAAAGSRAPAYLGVGDAADGTTRRLRSENLSNGLEMPSPAWGRNAGHMAEITFQAPVRVAIHATDLVPPGEGEHRVTGIRREGGAGSRITELGGPLRLQAGTMWRMSVEAVVEAISRGERFYVEEPAGDRAYLVTARSSTGRPYVKSLADGDAPNNLSSLPLLP